MDGIGAIGMVDKSYYRLTALSHHEGRPWRHSIVSDKTGLAQVWVDLLFERLDVHFIVIDRWVGERSECVSKR